MHYISLQVGQREFLGHGHSPTGARQCAAAKALYTMSYQGGRNFMGHHMDRRGVPDRNHQYRHDKPKGRVVNPFMTDNTMECGGRLASAA